MRSLGLAKPAPGCNVDELMFWLEPDVSAPVMRDSAARAVLASAASFLAHDWLWHADRGDNFTASLTILECLERIQ
jgi:hypothetical protein